MKPLPIEFEPNASFCYRLARYHLLPELAQEPESIFRYGTPMPLKAAAVKYELMTPPSAVKVLEAGYPLEVHSSAKGSH